MAYDLEARFRQLRPITSDTAPSPAPLASLRHNRDNRKHEPAIRQSGHDDWEQALQDSTTYNDNESIAATDTTAPQIPASTTCEDYASTPPIDMPTHSSTVADGLEERHDDNELLHESRYHEPSPLEDYFKNRRTSISFNPEVVHENGIKTSLEQPSAKLQIRTRLRGRSLLQELAKRPLRSPQGRAYTEADRQGYDSQTRELISSPSVRQLHSARERKFTPKQPYNPLLQQATVDDLPTDLDQSTSLGSVTTASPILEEVRTPPDSQQMDYLISPITVYSPWHHPTSLEESSAWPRPRRQPSTSRAKSYTLDRAPSFRPSRRQSSRRSSTSLSPATAFLSKWSREEPTPEADDEGQEVGDYVLGKEIGFGGFSIVREAYTLAGPTRLRHAVKIVRKYLAGRSEADNERLQADFDREVAIWRCLSHRHILPLLTVYVTDFATFAFTRLNTGGTLFDLVRANRTGLDPRLARRYAAQLAEAMRYLHEDVRVVHRDLKLENCLIDLANPETVALGGDLLLCDFGLAEFFSSDGGGGAGAAHSGNGDGDGTAEGSLLANAELASRIGASETSTSIAGSLQYAAPELILSPVGLLSTAVDMWAFGVVCF